jgi:hypothetical protein
MVALALDEKVAVVASSTCGPQSPPMRYRDAAHVDVGSFYARKPELGHTYRLLGYAALVGVLWHQANDAMLERLLIGLIILWLMAWYRVVGTLWRSSIVAATLLCATLLTMHRLWPTGVIS